MKSRKKQIVKYARAFVLLGSLTDSRWKRKRDLRKMIQGLLIFWTLRGRGEAYSMG